jgi:L1 cell adhesion molecule like protein
MLKHEGLAVGIDLGTSNGCVARYTGEHGCVTLLNALGKTLTPSYVGFPPPSDGTPAGGTPPVVGDEAKVGAAANPLNTVFDVKRLIGRQLGDPTIQADAKLWPFSLVDDDHGKPAISVDCMGARRSFAPEQILAMQLTDLRRLAESRVGQPVLHAVVTCPAYWNAAQRKAIRDVGALAELNILRVINEPTAAAIAYGLDKQDDERNVLIFDLGGGSFDVSLLSFEDGIMEVKATAGDTHLGGQDFVVRVMRHLVLEFNRSTPEVLASGANPEDDPRAMSLLRAASEAAMHTLSTQSSTQIEVPGFFGRHDLRTQLSRKQFEKLNMDLFRKTLDPVEKVLRDSKIASGRVDDVVLVGGSTRIPRLRQLLSDYFNGKTLCCSINPDEVVAHGAAIQAAILTGTGSAATEDLLLLDVHNRSLGIETAGGVMTTLIPRNTTIPTKKNQTFTTMGFGTGVSLSENLAENSIDESNGEQTSMRVQIYEGERRMTQDNNKLGELTLDGIRPAPAACRRSR